MKGMREIRNRMKAVASTGQITHAMELVAASKMKRAQNSAEAGRAYAILLMDLTETVLERLGKMISRAANIAGKKRLIIVFSTDKGLCGSLNSNIFKAIAEIPREEADYIAVGSRAGRFIAKTGRVLKGQFKISDAVAFAETRKVAEFAMKLAGDSGEYGSIEVLYPIFVNTLRQETALVKLAPADDLTPFIERLRKSYKMADVAVAAREERNVEFEPSAGEVLAQASAVLHKAEPPPHSARHQGFGALRAHGRDEERKRQRRRAAFGAQSGIQQGAPVGHHDRNTRTFVRRGRNRRATLKRNAK